MTCTGMENYSVECINNTLDFISMNSTPPSYPGTICETPQFLELYGLMVLLSCAAFLRFYHLLRLGTLTGELTLEFLFHKFRHHRCIFYYDDVHLSTVVLWLGSADFWKLDWKLQVIIKFIAYVDFYDQIFSDEENVPQMVINLLVMILLALTQFFEGRQNDWTTRMDYLRKIQVQTG